MKLNTIVKKSTLTVTAATMLLLILTGSAVAAGGLDPLINETEKAKDKLYQFLGVAAFVYLMYNVIMAKIGKQDWSDVFMALAKVAGAGGILAAGTFAWGMFA
ncbi:hypothetical protein TUM4438_31260 [Shewanella sairae]|uniref:TrbC/VirB2 family protein n=1 Tax=Shewanella sairae TaxID=190310 RepID=A0ABQ4PLD0_9GAMM|nr:hypothetical protein [Shewanella sairae]MCL1131896.1 hypothetical protein [Shewanella sairae]GIU48878.1 hypothetical protein TUM4438_31260 [Shewanella sairae]